MNIFYALLGYAVVLLVGSVLAFYACAVAWATVKWLALAAHGRVRRVPSPTWWAVFRALDWGGDQD